MLGKRVIHVLQDKHPEMLIIEAGAEGAIAFEASDSLLTTMLLDCNKYLVSSVAKKLQG